MKILSSKETNDALRFCSRAFAKLCYHRRNRNRKEIIYLVPNDFKYSIFECIKNSFCDYNAVYHLMNDELFIYEAVKFRFESPTNHIYVYVKNWQQTGCRVHILNLETFEVS